MLKKKVLSVIICFSLMGSIMACGKKGTDIDVRDSEDKYHIKVNAATDEVTLACTIDTIGADEEGTVENGTAEWWTVVLRNCNVNQDPNINFDQISYNTTYKMSKDFKKLFEKYWSEVTDKENGLFEITEDNKTSSMDAEDICEFLAFGELWDENPELFSVERPIVEPRSDGAQEIFLVYDGMEEKYEEADLDKNGYISAREYLQLKLSTSEEIINKYK